MASNSGEGSSDNMDWLFMEPPAHSSAPVIPDAFKPRELNEMTIAELKNELRDHLASAQPLTPGQEADFRTLTPEQKADFRNWHKRLLGQHDSLKTEINGLEKILKLPREELLDWLDHRRLPEIAKDMLKEHVKESKALSEKQGDELDKFLEKFDHEVDPARRDDVLERMEAMSEASDENIHEQLDAEYEAEINPEEYERQKILQVMPKRAQLIKEKSSKQTTTTRGTRPPSSLRNVIFSASAEEAASPSVEQAASASIGQPASATTEQAAPSSAEQGSPGATQPQQSRKWKREKSQWTQLLHKKLQGIVSRRLLPGEKDLKAKQSEQRNKLEQQHKEEVKSLINKQIHDLAQMPAGGATTDVSLLVLIEATQQEWKTRLTDKQKKLAQVTTQIEDVARLLHLNAQKAKLQSPAGSAADFLMETPPGASGYANVSLTPSPEEMDIKNKLGDFLRQVRESEIILAKADIDTIFRWNNTLRNAHWMVKNKLLECTPDLAQKERDLSAQYAREKNAYSSVTTIEKDRGKKTGKAIEKNNKQQEKLQAQINQQPDNPELSARLDKLRMKRASIDETSSEQKKIIDSIPTKEMFMRLRHQEEKATLDSELVEKNRERHPDMVERFTDLKNTLNQVHEILKTQQQRVQAASQQSIPSGSVGSSSVTAPAPIAESSGSTSFASGPLNLPGRTQRQGISIPATQPSPVASSSAGPSEPRPTKQLRITTETSPPSSVAGSSASGPLNLPDPMVGLETISPATQPSQVVASSSATPPAPPVETRRSTRSATKNDFGQFTEAEVDAIKKEFGSGNYEPALGEVSYRVGAKSLHLEIQTENGAREIKSAVFRLRQKADGGRYTSKVFKLSGNQIDKETKDALLGGKKLVTFTPIPALASTNPRKRRASGMN